MEKKKRKKSSLKLKEALKRVLEEKPFQEVTVKEVCLTAGLNRSTFYENYDSLDDILYELQLDYFRELFGQIAREQPADGSRPDEALRLDMMRRVVHYHASNSTYLLTLLQNNVAGVLETNLMRYLKQEFLRSGYTKEDEYRLIYMFTGNLTAVISWLLDGRPGGEEAFARFLVTL